ncbi:PaaI family thioesterase [Pararhodobacter sp.]|uniref:PaaI family thioesterase n=1 Tax=Pararhodobacter sp. TaxID=2127056 RepID=UPI002AFEA406|nr:PaaI family thioesterase [Pararhodobacter sp.]
MSGLEMMTAIQNGDMPGAPIAGLMGFYLHSVAKGQVAFRGAPAFAHLNPMGGVHGGWYGTILDSALGCAVATTLARGSHYTTLEYKVNLTRALKPGTVVECAARVQHAGRSTAVAEATIIGVEDGKLYATGSTTCIIMTP